MSLINQFIKQVSTLEESYNNDISQYMKQFEEELDKKNLFVSPKCEKINKFYDELIQLHENTSRKLEEKLNQVDPVTGEKRYGAQTQQKFLEASNKLQSVVDTFVPWCIEWKPAYDQFLIEEQLSKEQQNKSQEEALKALSHQEQQKKEEERLKKELELKEQQQKETENTQRLREQAEIARKRKAEEIENINDLSERVVSSFTVAFLILFFRL
jgi:predicted  nucleic acid-binding Zn-ribbon protein